MCKLVKIFFLLTNVTKILKLFFLIILFFKIIDESWESHLLPHKITITCIILLYIRRSL